PSSRQPAQPSRILDNNHPRQPQAVLPERCRAKRAKLPDHASGRDALALHKPPLGPHPISRWGTNRSREIWPFPSAPGSQKDPKTDGAWRALGVLRRSPRASKELARPRGRRAALAVRRACPALISSIQEGTTKHARVQGTEPM